MFDRCSGSSRLQVSRIGRWIVATAMALSLLLSAAGAAAASEDDGTDQFSAVLLGSDPSGAAQLAVRWTGDPSARLSAWIDVPGDPRSDGHQVLDQVVLDEGMELFSIQGPPHYRGLVGPTLPIRFQLSRDGHALWTRHENVDWIVDKASPLTYPAQSATSDSEEACQWLDGFHMEGLSNSVFASAVFDDGTGPALYLGGNFQAGDDVALHQIGKWDGSKWSPVGSGIDHDAPYRSRWVSALEVFDDGSGPVLVAAGAASGLSGYVAQWDGNEWTHIGSELDRAVNTLEVFSTEEGTVLVAGGRFTTVDGIPANRIAQWDGGAWSPLGAGVTGIVHDLAVFDDGNGPVLVATDGFSMAGGATANNIAQWDGERWSELGGGLSGQPGVLHVFQADGEEPVLIVGGRFTSAGDVPVRNIAQWDGTRWSPLGSGFDFGVYALSQYPGPDGPVLVAGGYLSATSEGSIAMWDGERWSAMGEGLGFQVWTLATLGSGADERFIAAGNSKSLGYWNSSNFIMQWDGNAWEPLTSGGPAHGLPRELSDIVVFHHGDEAVLVAAGWFMTAGGVEANAIAQWDGERWAPLGTGFHPGSISALTVYESAGHRVLVAGGAFSEAGGEPAASIAQWDGTDWYPLGLGIKGSVNALATYDDGNGPVLIAGGEFWEAGGLPARNIAQWDGTAWAPLGAGSLSWINALAVYDDGAGPKLLAGGAFFVPGSGGGSIGQWDGSSWIPLDTPPLVGDVSALAILEDPDGRSRIIAGGVLWWPDEELVPRYIAQWDGETWSGLGAGLNGDVNALAVRGSGEGQVLIAGGRFTTAGGLAANHLAQWDGASWVPLGSGTDQSVHMFEMWDDDHGPLLVAGGYFQLAGGKASSRIAMQACPHLPVTLTQYTDEVVAGGTVTYGLTIENSGMLDATAIPILAEFAEPLAACRWSSTGSGGATGYTSGTGSALDDVLDLPIDGSVHYVISCAVSASATGEVQLAATASVPGVGITTSATEVDIVVDRPNVSTLILAHPARMMEQMGATLDELESLMSGLDAFAAHTNVDGLVLDVGFHDELAELYAAWDAEIENSDSEPVPDTANHVLFGHEGSAQNDDGKEGLHDLVRSVLEDRPDIDHVMLIGDDRIIPMARIQDRTYEPSELDYHDVDHESSTVGHALAWDQYLSDDPIGVDGPVTARPLQTVRRLRLIPDVAVGRLVETPTEIRHSLETFLELDGRIDLTGLDPDHRVLVAGYDFLVDSATQIREHWNSRFGWPDDEAASAPVNGQLIGRTWGLGSAEEREDALLERWTGFGTGAYRVMSLNGHANHYEEGVPGQNLSDIRGLATSEIAPLSPELGGRGSLIYAVGCHGGLPVPGSDPNDEDKSLDLPQTLLGRGALGYLANSGFGWGLHHHVGYSEKLMLLFTEELAQPGTVTVGDAMLRAKQRYYHEDASWNPFDVKTSLQWTLFGFPMVKVETGIAETREADSRRGLTDAAAQTGGCLDLPDHLICDASVSFMSDFGTFEKYRTGGDTPLVDVEGCPPPADGELEGCYYALNGLTVTEGGLPIEPVLIDDSRRAGTSQHGVLWTGGRYDEEAGWVPSMAQPVSSHGPLPLAGPLPKTTFIRPRGRASGGATDSSQQCTPTDTELNSLVFVPAELIFDDALEPTIHRLHTEVGLETFYFNNRVDGVGNCDRLGPQFDSGPYHSVDGDTVLFSVAVDDDFVAGEPRLGVWRVVVVWDHAAESRWKPIELTFDEASGRWIGELERPGDADSIVYFLQAVDVRGNVSWAPFEAPDRGTSVQDVESGLPRPIEVILPPAGLLFWDDFETADTSRWSSAN